MIAAFIRAYMDAKPDNTRRALRITLDDFCKQLKRDLAALGHEKPSEIMQYLATSRALGRAAATIKQRYYLLSGLYRSLELAELARNPFPASRAALPRETIQVRPTHCFAEGEIKRLLEMPGRTRQGIVDRATLALLFGGGLRRSEAIGLKVGDVRITEGILWLAVRGKGGVERRQALSAGMAERLSELVSQRAADGACGADALLVTYRAGKALAMSASAIYRRYKQYTGKAPHSARASAATLLLERGADYGEVARFLGHRTNIATVAAYDHRRKLLQNHPGRLLNY